MRPRLPPVVHPDDTQSEALARTRLNVAGEPLNLFATVAHRPQLLTALNTLGAYLRGSTLIPARERELVILRTAWYTASDYEIGHHRDMGARAGLSTVEMDAAVSGTHRHQWSIDDAALLSFVDELLRTDDVSDTVWADVGRRCDLVVRLELLVRVGYYRMLAGILNGLRVEPDGSEAGD